jgi:peptidoglycan/xylan/chitin deacetylase (PgdA/CDA1 family)
MKAIREVFLTFDVEDFISDNSILALRFILECLEKHRLRAIFFITGQMAEKLQDFPHVLRLLAEHEIGYHSSSHSVHPTIFEFTDVNDYEEAYLVSLKRETAHINLFNGEIEGNGGINTLRSLFPGKEVVSYRSPGCCWSPPHIEALRDLGIKFDFSASLNNRPIYHKGLTFYTYPIIAHWTGEASEYRLLLLSLLKSKSSVLGLHPSLFVNRTEWDSIYHEGNPKHITKPLARTHQQINLLFRRFDSFLKQLQLLQKTGVIMVATALQESDRRPIVSENLVKKCYSISMKWPRQRFHYEPKFLRNHFFRFFGA